MELLIWCVEEVWDGIWICWHDLHTFYKCKIMCQCQWIEITSFPNPMQGTVGLLTCSLFIHPCRWMLNVMVNEIVDCKDIARVFLLRKEKQHLIPQSTNDISLIIKIEEKFVNNIVNILHDFETALVLEINDRKKKFTYY